MYEDLRQRGSSGKAEASLEHTLLVTQGVASWLQTTLSLIPPPALNQIRNPSPTSSSAPLIPADAKSELAQTLATLALSSAQERAP